MQRASSIGVLLKKIYRIYGQQLLVILQSKGYTDLRPSFLEILLCLSEREGRSIKYIGKYCGLKKQTMTSHLNELETRGYIKRLASDLDKRENLVYFTEYGEKFKLSLIESVNEIEKEFLRLVGEIELERIEKLLLNFHSKIESINNVSALGRGLSLDQLSTIESWNF